MNKNVLKTEGTRSAKGIAGVHFISPKRAAWSVIATVAIALLAYWTTTLCPGEDSYRIFSSTMAVGCTVVVTGFAATVFWYTFLEGFFAAKKYEKPDDHSNANQIRSFCAMGMVVTIVVAAVILLYGIPWLRSVTLTQDELMALRAAGVWW